MDIVYLCIKIFGARIVDVSLGTIRTVYIIKEKRFIATLIAFFEVLIWFEIAREALNTSVNFIMVPISYAGGYAMGTYIGTLISSKYIKGHLTLNVFSNKIKNSDIEFLKKQGFGLSTINTCDNKKILLIEIEKEYLKDVENLLLTIDKKAFIIISETKIVHNGYIK